MAIRKIVLAGAPVLKTKAQPVTKMTKSIKTLLKDMKDTLYDANGVGLAAPQVGESLTATVMWNILTRKLLLYLTKKKK